jgi:hypothetical protein
MTAIARTGVLSGRLLQDSNPPFGDVLRIGTKR